MANKPSKIKQLWDDALAVWNESALSSQVGLSRMHRFAHFWVMVGKSFTRNRCPVRAASLAYATLLALIPMLAVVVGVTSTFLKQEGEDKIDQLIVHFVASITPAAPSGTNTAALEVPGSEAPPDPGGTNLAPSSAGGFSTNTAALPAFAQAEDAVNARRQIARKINEFIQNTRSAALGWTGAVMLVFVGISMLARVEDTFNDIWGVGRGRSWTRRIVLYWTVITLGSMLLVVALGLATGPHFETTRKLLGSLPFLGNLLFQFLPVAVLCFTFSLIYALMPNTKVQWTAAAVGGLASGLLFHVNNLFSVLYVSRVVSNSKIYGSLGLVPVFMIGLYFSWLILLFGGQVAYAWQNRATYLEEKQTENVNQRGREFVALRLMTAIGQHFVRGAPPPTTPQLAAELSVPGRLIRQIMRTLTAARLVVETAGSENGFAPARPIEQVSCHDILQAMRASQGQELATRDEPTRVEVLGEFQRIQEAERHAAAAVSMLALVHRAEAQLADSQTKALPGLVAPETPTPQST